MWIQNRHCNVFLAAPLGKFAIEEKMSGNMIGTIDLRVDPLKEVAELGYTLNKAFWGQGIVRKLGCFCLWVLKISACSYLCTARSAKSSIWSRDGKIGMKVEAQIRLREDFVGK